MQEKLYEIGGDIEITDLDDTAEEDLLDGINDIILSDVDNPYDVFQKLKSCADGKRYIYLDGFLSESALENLEDLLDAYGVRLA